VVAIVGGIVLLAWPGETLKVVAVVAGLTVLAWGVVRVVAAFCGPRATRSHDIAVGIALVVLGLLMMVWPGATVTLIGVFVGLAAIVWGVVMVIGCLQPAQDGAALAGAARQDARPPLKGRPAPRERHTMRPARL